MFLFASAAALPLLVLGATACSGGSGGSDGAPPPVAAPRLVAVPEVLEPGATVELRPAFGAGVGRIDPHVGTVESGGTYRVGPFASARRFTLTVERDGAVETASVTLPFRYRERIAAAPASPIARSRHATATLPGGAVLLVGGSSPGPLLWANSERVDATGGTFAPVGELSTGRAAAAVVVQPEGSVLAFGGDHNTSSFEVATRVEEWDPAALAWSVRGNLRCNRGRHTATALGDGRVLVAGGLAFGGTAQERAAEVWDPAMGSRLPQGGAPQWRASHVAVRLGDGGVLLAGGQDPSTGEFVAMAERFDPATETFAPLGALAVPRIHAAAALLPDGTVWLGGGEDASGAMLDSIELFDPATGTWSPGGRLGQARAQPRVLWLGSGELLIAGGEPAATAASDLVELWRPDGTVRPFAQRLPAPRTGHSLHLLADGRVLLLGGDAGSGIPTPSAFVID